jgi:hypothetical protein
MKRMRRRAEGGERMGSVRAKVGKMLTSAA